MANILDMFKKRSGKAKSKPAAPDVDRLTLESIVELKEKLSSNPKDDYSQNLSAIVKDFFQKFFKIKYNFTYEELITEANKGKLSSELKTRISSFLDNLTSAEYSSATSTSKTLLQRIQQFEDLVIRLSYVKVVPQPTAKKPKAEKIQPKPALIDTLKQKTSSVIENLKPSKPKKELAKPLPEKPEDELGRIYELFSQAYEAISDSNLSTAKELSLQIKKLYASLDQDARTQFSDEITDLEQSLAQLEAEQPLPKKEKPVEMPKKAPLKKAIPKPERPQIIREPDTTSLLLKSQIEDLRSEVARLSQNIAGSQTEFRNILGTTLWEERNKGSVLTTQFDQLTRQITDLNKNLRKQPPVAGIPEPRPMQREKPLEEKPGKIEIHKHDITKKQPFETPEPSIKLEAPTFQHLVDRFTQKKPAPVPQPIWQPAEKPAEPLSRKKVRLVLTKKRQPVELQEPKLPTPAQEYLAKAESDYKEFLSIEQLHEQLEQQGRLKEEKLREEISPFDRFIDKLTPTKKARLSPEAPELPKLAPLDADSEKITQLVEQIYQDIDRKSEERLKARKLKPILQEITPLPPTPATDDIDSLRRISGLIREVYIQIRDKNIEETRRLWSQIKELEGSLSEETKSEIREDIAGIEAQLDTMGPAPAAPQEDSRPDYNEKIASVVRNWQSASLTPLTITEKIIPTSQTKPKAPKQKREPVKTPTLAELDLTIQSAKSLLKSKQLEDAREAYQKALTLRKRLKLAPEAKSRVNYDLMDINVELRMAEIR